MLTFQSPVCVVCVGASAGEGEKGGCFKKAKTNHIKHGVFLIGLQLERSTQNVCFYFFVFFFKQQGSICLSLTIWLLIGLSPASLYPV